MVNTYRGKIAERIMETPILLFEAVILYLIK
jgi:hypothetical protein